MEPEQNKCYLHDSLVLPKYSSTVSKKNQITKAKVKRGVVSRGKVDKECCK